jgi:hypothetical protein
MMEINILGLTRHHSEHTILIDDSHVDIQLAIAPGIDVKGI